MEEDALHVLVVVMMVAMRMVIISVAMPVIMPMAMVGVSKSCEAYNIH